MTLRTVRPSDPEERWLWPPSPRDWLPEDHRAYCLSDLVDALDLKAILATSRGVTRGHAPDDPRMLVTMLRSAYAVGIPASRQMARELEEEVAVRVLAANQRPDCRTISDVRKQHLTALADRFVQILTLCQRAGVVKLGHIALDGTKVQANASKHQAMSDGRMGTEEARLQAEVEALLKRAEAADARDDAAYGPTGVAMHGRRSWPGGSRGSRPSGPPRRSWNKRRRRPPRSRRRPARHASGRDHAGVDPRRRPARSLPRRPNGTSRIPRVGSCRPPVPRAELPARV